MSTKSNTLALTERLSQVMPYSFFRIRRISYWVKWWSGSEFFCRTSNMRRMRIFFRSLPYMINHQFHYNIKLFNLVRTNFLRSSAYSSKFDNDKSTSGIKWSAKNFVLEHERAEHSLLTQSTSGISFFD